MPPVSVDGLSLPLTGVLADGACTMLTVQCDGIVVFGEGSLTAGDSTSDGTSSTNVHIDVTVTVLSTDDQSETADTRVNVPANANLRIGRITSGTSRR